MKILPRELFKRQNIIDLEKVCVSAFVKYRWPNGFVCSKCRNTAAWYFRSRRLYKCSGCRHQVSLTAVGMFLDFFKLFLVKDYLVGLNCRINQGLDKSGQPLELIVKTLFSNKRFVWLMAAVVACFMYITP